MIVEDDPALQKQMRWAFDQYETVVASNREEAIAQLRRHEPAVVTMDLGLPPAPDDVTEGFRLLGEILALAPDTKVVVLTGQHDRENAVRAVGMGAYDFFAKPFEPELLALTLDRALRMYDLQQDNRRLKVQQGSALSGVITRDAGMLKVCRLIEKVASANVTVMLLGESGTGKEVLARGLHELSPRRNERFVAINCAAIPENLLESELFGYEKGAFTGAVKQTLGKIEVANKGTLFLDEIGDLPMPLQAKLLRFLQERVIERIGGRKPIPVDTRIVCATHQDLDAMVADGRFREDLYYRLAEIVVRIPSLAERPGDAGLLARHFLRRYARQMNAGVTGFAPDALAAIDAWNWPGNVRELENRVKRAVIMADAKQVTAADLDLDHGEAEPINLKAIREEADRRAIRHALARAQGNISGTARLLGISRPTLYDLMKAYDLQP